MFRFIEIARLDGNCPLNCTAKESDLYKRRINGSSCGVACQRPEGVEYTVRMKPRMTIAIITLFAVLAGSGGPVSASSFEVYHWVDENGVEHYSQDPPPEDVRGVRLMQLEDTTPTGFDPEEDIYGVDQQAERIAALREEMQQRREAAIERQRLAPRPPVVIYQEPYASWPWLTPVYPWRPTRPEPPPIAVPYRTATLAPPRR